MAISANVARSVFLAAANAATSTAVDAKWSAKIEHLSALCLSGGSFTHIAFLGTSILAKAANESVNLFAIKPTHEVEKGDAYSARMLCHKVLVPLSAELGINIGVNGREPLNNQPYFRMTRLGDETPVHTQARPAFDYMIELVKELQHSTAAEAQAALSAFISVRRRHQIVYARHDGLLAVSWVTLASAISQLVTENSEGGRRAQAAVAGLFDVFAGPDRVASGKINDPSRHYPGDVAVRGFESGWDKVVEVRDKKVTDSDVYIFGRTCLSKGVREAAVLLAAANQPQLNDSAISKWAADTGLGLTLFYGWDVFVDQVLFWSELPKSDGVSLAVERIEARLIGVEASADAVMSWQRLTRVTSD